MKPGSVHNFVLDWAIDLIVSHNILEVTPYKTTLLEITRNYQKSRNLPEINPGTSNSLFLTDNLQARPIFYPGTSNFLFMTIQTFRLDLTSSLAPQIPYFWLRNLQATTNIYPSTLNFLFMTGKTCLLSLEDLCSFLPLWSSSEKWASGEWSSIPCSTCSEELLQTWDLCSCVCIRCQEQN